MINPYEHLTFSQDPAPLTAEERVAWGAIPSPADYFSEIEFYIRFPQGSPYPRFAIREEIGELAGKYAKLCRGDYDSGDRFQLEVDLELGDILFNIVYLAWTLNSSLEPIYRYWDVSPPPLQNKSLESDLKLSRIAIMNARASHHSIAPLVYSFCFFSNRSLREIAARNLVKLESRAQRGVIRGQGDNR